MPWRKIFSFVCPMTCVACLAAGYARVGQWLAFAIMLLAFLAWLSARIWPSAELCSIALVVSVSLAAAGVFAGASPFLMVLGATLALAGWDLVLFDHSLTGDSSSSAKAMALFENRHYQSLAAALGLGVLVAVTGQMIRLQIPLGGLVLLVVLVLTSLNRVWSTLLK